MNTIGKIITGVLTLAYSLLVILTLWSLARLMEDPILSYDPIFLTALGIVGFGLLVFYSNHLAENEDVGRGPRIIWFIRFFLLGFISFPLYWVSYIMRSAPGEDEEE